MANVGNLFVNISGNTKGLTKALGNAKRSIRGFGKEAAGMLGMGKGSEQALNVYRALSTKMAGQMAEGDLKGARQTKRMRELYRPQAEQFQQYSQAQARLATSATLGVLGLTVAGVSMMGRKAMTQVQSARAGVEQFKYLGPEGKRIIQAEIDMLMNSIKTAQRKDISTAIAEKTEAQLAAQIEANFGGGTALSLSASEFFERLGQAFTSAVSGLANDPAGYMTNLMSAYNPRNPFNQPPSDTQGSSQP